MLELRGVTKVHRRGDREVHSLRGVDLRVDPGEFVTIMGPSGSGKSTLLHLLGGLDTPTTGAVLFRGLDFRTLSDRVRSVIRRESIGFVFQSFNLLPTLTAVENVALPLLLAGQSRRQARGARTRGAGAPGAGRAVGALPRRAFGGRDPARRDRAGPGDRAAAGALRRADRQPRLVGRPAALQRGSAPVAGRRSVVLVTHDPQAAHYGDRLVLIHDGRVASEERLRGRHAHAATHA